MRTTRFDLCVYILRVLTVAFRDNTSPYLFVGFDGYYCFMTLNVYAEAVEQVTTNDEILEAYREVMGIEQEEEVTLMWYRLPLDWEKAKSRAMKKSVRKAKLGSQSAEAS